MYGNRILHLQPDRFPGFDSQTPMSALNALPHAIRSYLDTHRFLPNIARALTGFQARRFVAPCQKAEQKDQCGEKLIEKHFLKWRRHFEPRWAGMARSASASESGSTSFAVPKLSIRTVCYSDGQNLGGALRTHPYPFEQAFE